MASHDDVFKTVRDVTAEKLGITADEIKPESSFIDDLGADSLDTVELIMGLEDKFEIEISDEEAEKIRTIKDAVDFIVNKKG